MEFAASASGRMLAVGLPPDKAEPYLKDFTGRVHLGAVNSPESVTFTGDTEPLEIIECRLLKDNVFCRFIKTKYAFHSHHMEGMKDELLNTLKGIKAQAPRIPVYSTVTGQLANDNDFSCEYWWDNVRKQVKFAQAIEDLIRKQFTVFLEISPHPVLTSAVTESLLHHQHQASVFSSLKRDRRDRFNLLTTLSALHSEGLKVHWDIFYPGHYFEADLPRSPYYREKSWHQTELVKNFLNKVEHNSLLGFSLSNPYPAWENQINQYTHPFLKDHCVHGHKLLPGTAYLESGFTLANQMENQAYPILEQVSLLKTAFLPKKQNLWTRTIYDPEEKVFQIFCRDENETKKWNLHATGSILFTSTQEKKRVPLKTLLGKYKKILTKEKCYSLFKKIGMEYGPSFMGINRLYCGQGESLAEVKAPKQILNEISQFQFHPALLDACLQAIIGTNVLDQRKSYLPVYFKSIKFFHKPGPYLWSHVKFAAGNGKKILADIEILDDKGYIIAEIDKLELHGIAIHSDKISASIDDMLYQYEWISQPRPQKQYKAQNEDNENQPGVWLIFVDGSGTDLELPEQFKNIGDKCFSIYPGKSYERIDADRFRISQHIKADLSRILKSINKENSSHKIRGIIDLSSMEVPSLNDLNPREYTHIIGKTSLKLLNLIQTVMEWKDRDLPRLWIVTRGAQSVRKKIESVSPFQSSIWGLGRVVVNEMPALRCTLIDLDPADRKVTNRSLAGKQLFNEILTDGTEDEIALRGKNRYIHRLRKSRLTMDRNPLSLGDKENFRLETTQPGMLDSLLFRRIKRIDPGADEVEIKVKAAGLNFSDIMKGLNLYPGLPEGPIPLGIECAGVITRTGIKVKNWKPGDKVIALAPFSFSAYVIAPEYFLIPFPEKMTFKEAAALPLAYLTAHYALIPKGRLLKGEKILIHSASGGVGLAAVQIARYIGAEIFATAGSPEKREYLRSFGLKHVMDSRSLNFASEIMEKTNGQGVDMVLNSLSGQAITKGLSILRDYGRFLEIGKSDIYTNKKIGLYPFHKNLSFFSIDLDKIMREDPALIQLLLKEITSNISEGNYPPLPCKTYPYSKAKEAFRFMAAAKHIGKIVLYTDKDTIKVSPAQKTQIKFKQDATYLITGGFGGFGLLVADWLVSHGAKNLALMGRNGSQSSESQRLIKKLSRKQVKIIEICGDISKKLEVERALTRIKTSLPPLRGIFHLAMVLDDALLSNLTLKQMYKVLNPKILGAWHLHEHSKDLKLDCFVLFSSVSSLIGMPGQGNYVTANAFLDGLSFYRRSQKLPSITINWGFLGKTGIAARNKETAARFENQGLKSFSPEQAMDILANFLEFDPAQMAVINMDWSRFGQMLQRYAISPKFSDLWEVDEGETGDQSLGLKGKSSFRKLLFTVPEEEKSELLLKALRDQMAKILGESSEKLDIEKPLSELGFDSLMAVELRNWADNNLGVRLPTIEVMKGPSIVQLSHKLIQIFTEQIKKFSTSAPKKVKTKILSETFQRKFTENSLTAIDELTDEEVESMLHELLDDEKK
jgi:NADPH:quinone reductase-like Zn-dependent oxidoreductase/NAD(P)-dependent dehydrogenase (short-subunit alcohol dehydrogenase family)/acyl carrier protein